MKKKSIVITILLFSALIPARATTMLDSLKNLYDNHVKTHGVDEKAIDVLSEIVGIASLISPEAQITSIERLEQESQRVGSKKGLQYALAARQGYEHTFGSKEKSDSLLRIIKTELEQVTDKSVKAALLASLELESFTRSDFAAAIKSSLELNRIAKESGNNVSFALSLENLRLIYTAIGDTSNQDRIIHEIRKTLRMAPNDQIRYMLTQNLAASFELSESLSFGIRSKEIAVRQGWYISIALSDISIGVVLSLKNQFKECLRFTKEADSIAVKYHVSYYEIYTKNNIADTYYRLQQYDSAIHYGKLALAVARDRHDMVVQEGVTATLDSAYRAIGDYRNALYYNDILKSVQDSILNKDVLNKVANARVEAEKDKKNAELELEKSERSRQTLLRNISIASFLLITLGSLFLYRNYRRTKKSEQANEMLLLNILPENIAKRLKGGEETIAEKHQSVSILFADIVNFTHLSTILAPEELVTGLNDVFTIVDQLTVKYSLEKIKTIGDAYMVIAGAPSPMDNHPEVIAKFALDLIAQVQTRRFAHLDRIEIRIGIHCGEVVAGVIGTKKFAYDLWGDAVNTAARMESHGEAGRIHVSEAFKNAVEKLESNVPLLFEERGEIDIKGKGVMRTFFLEKQE